MDVYYKLILNTVTVKKIVDSSLTEDKEKDFSFSYRIGTSTTETSFSLSDQGTKAIKLLKGKTIYLREVNADGFVVTVKQGDTTLEPDSYGWIHVEVTEDTEIEYTNTRAFQPVVFKKVDLTDTSQDPQGLPGAVFTMVYQGTPTAEYTLTSTDGTFKAKQGDTEIDRLPIGEYKLTETTPPAGYDPVSGEMILKVAQGGVSFIQPDYSGGEPQTITPDSEGIYTVVIRDNPGIALPSTGGPGTRLFTILGLALMMGAGAVLFRRRMGA